MSPPYYAYGLFALDFTNMGLSWIAAITYAYKIAPPNLAATVAAIANTIHFVLGKFKIYRMCVKDRGLHSQKY
jgi:hypothetical protein